MGGTREEMAGEIQSGKPRQLRRLQRTLACRGSVVDLYKDTMQLPDGELAEYDYVHHKKGGGACVVPVLPDGRILLVRQYRPAVEADTLELPAGAREMISSGGINGGTPGGKNCGAPEDTRVTARRELREETGYRAEKLTFLLSILSAPAYCNEFTDIYLAEDLVKEGSQQLDEAEEIRLEARSLDELLHLISAGKLRDAKTAAGILAYAFHRKTQ